MYKEAEEHELLRQALLGMLMGGGAYSGMRLLNNMGSASTPPKKSPHELDITLPASRMPKLAEHSPMDYLAPLLAGGGGFAGGFFGASKLYEMHRQKQLEEQKQQAEQEYMQSLQHAHGKVASVATPFVDKFLEGIITKIGEEITKEAGMFPDEGPGDIIGHGIKGAWNGFKNSEVGAGTIAAWLATALTTGGLTYGIARNMDKTKERNKQQTTLPSDTHLRTV